MVMKKLGRIRINSNRVTRARKTLTEILKILKEVRKGSNEPEIDFKSS